MKSVFDKIKYEFKSVHKFIFIFSLPLYFFCNSCKKLVEIDPPTKSITTAEVFSDSADAASAILGIYANLNGNGNIGFGNGVLTEYCGLSADELINFNDDPYLNQFYQNLLLSDNGVVSNYFWNQPYFNIYQANACLEGLQQSSGIPDNVKDKLISETKFLRAFCYFYLVNFFGDLPYVTSTAWEQTASTSRTAKEQIYTQIIADLQNAQDSLPSDYSVGNGERIRANKWAATALLARVYLYTKDWKKAADQASSIINNTTDFALASDPNEVFIPNSNESILQWQTNTSFYPFNGTVEGATIIPFDQTSNPNFYLTNDLLNAFETDDQRKIAWLDSTTYNGTVYYYPYKYKTGPAQQDPNATATEYYTMLRLAEQYLIRAEANAQQNNLQEAISDVNTIRSRALLTPLPNSLNQTQTLAAIMQERKIELFAEWGHRWLDLKRTGQADVVLGLVKAGWQSNAQLYPIPKGELITDHNLTQNPGY